MSQWDGRLPEVALMLSTYKVITCLLAVAYGNLIRKTRRSQRTSSEFHEPPQKGVVNVQDILAIQNESVPQDNFN